jgi:hypothetical protein
MSFCDGGVSVPESVPEMFQKNHPLLEQKSALAGSKTQFVPMFHVWSKKSFLELEQSRQKGL